MFYYWFILERSCHVVTTSNATVNHDSLRPIRRLFGVPKAAVAVDMEAIITSAGLVLRIAITQTINFSFVLGSVIPCVALIWLAYISNGQHTLALVLLNVAIGTNAVYLYGSLINHVDLSPKYAGVLIGIENTISQAISMFGPVFIQYVVTDLVSID